MRHEIEVAEIKFDIVMQIIMEIETEKTSITIREENSHFEYTAEKWGKKFTRIQEREPIHSDRVQFTWEPWIDSCERGSSSNSEYVYIMSQFRKTRGDEPFIKYSYSKYNEEWKDVLLVLGMEIIS